MSFSISYIFSLVDKFTPGAAAISAAATNMRGAIAAAGAAMGPLIARMAAVAAGVGLLAAAFVLGGVKQAAAFEESLTSLRRVTNISREDMLAYGRDALKVGVQTGRSGEAIAAIMTEGSLLGIRGQKPLMEFARLAAKVGVTWDDMGDKMAAEGLGTLSAQFFSNMAPEDATRRLQETADAINEISNRSAFKAPELLKAFKKGGAAAADIGLTPEQYSAYIGTAMVRGSKSGDLQGTRAEMTFRKLAQNAVDPTKRAAEAMRQLGYTPKSLRAAINANPQDAILDILERTKKYAGDDRLKGMAVIGDLVDKRSASQLTSMSGNINEYKKQLAIADDAYAAKFAKDDGFMAWLRNGDEGLKQIADQLQRYNKVVTRSGSVNREFGNKTESLNFAIAQLGLSWDRFRILLAMPLLEPLRHITNGLSDFTNALGDIAERSPAVGTMMTGGLMAGMTAMGAAVAAAGAKMLGFTGAYATLATIAKTAGRISLWVGVTIAAYEGLRWIYTHWPQLKAWAADPLNFEIHFPDAPPWLKQFLDYKAMTKTQDEAAKAYRDMSAGKGLPGDLAAAKNGPGPWNLWGLIGGGAASPSDEWYAQMAGRISAFNLPPMPAAAGAVGGPPLPAPNPDRIPQAAAERVQIESTIRGEIAPLQVTATPITVHVTGQVNGPVTGTGSGSLSTNAPRGVSTSEAGSTSVSP